MFHDPYYVTGRIFQLIFKSMTYAKSIAILERVILQLVTHTEDAVTPPV
jgi:hypothetical protein